MSSVHGKLPLPYTGFQLLFFILTVPCLCVDTQNARHYALTAGALRTGDAAQAWHPGATGEAMKPGHVQVLLASWRNRLRMHFPKPTRVVK